MIRTTLVVVCLCLQRLPVVTYHTRALTAQHLLISPLPDSCHSDTSHFKRINYHERLVIAHITLMEALQATYGAMIPDVEFVIGTADMPEMYVETRIPPAHPPNNSPSNLQASTDSFSESDLEAHPFQAKSGDSSVLKRPEGAEAGSENIAVASDGRVDQEHRNYFPATSNQLPHRVLNADTSQDNAMKLSLNQNLSESVMVSMPQLQPTQSAEGKKARAMAEDSGLRHQQRHRALLRHPNSSVTVQSVGAGFSSPPLLMLRFCKSVHHADVLVPDIHFQVRTDSPTEVCKFVRLGSSTDKV